MANEPKVGDWVCWSRLTGHAPRHMTLNRSLNGRKFYHAKCECGADGQLKSGHQVAMAWHRAHKAAILASLGRTGEQ